MGSAGAVCVLRRPLWRRGVDSDFCEFKNKSKQIETIRNAPVVRGGAVRRGEQVRKVAAGQARRQRRLRRLRELSEVGCVL